MTRRRSRNRLAGMTVLELCLAIFVVGTFIAMFVPAFVRHFEPDRLAAAERDLRDLSEHVSAYYRATHDVRGRQRTHCLPRSAGPSPERPPAGDAAPFEPDSESGQVWEALSFEPRSPTRFSYRLTSRGEQCSVRGAGTLVELELIGDIDGDRLTSHFVLSLGHADGELVPLGPVRSVRRTE